MPKISDLKQLPSTPGAYVLQISLPEVLQTEIRSLKSPCLQAGRYLYCGSAKGPGGIGARVRRHLKRDKKPHWHVDRLTIAHGVEAFSLFEHGSECDLVKHLLKMKVATPAFPGFGSSDCPTCPAHLLRLEQGLSLDSCQFNVPVFLPAHGTSF